MNLDFQATITALGGNQAMMRIANEARPPSDYLFASLLPEINKADYYVESGTMTIRTTMAGLVGMDSPYPPGSSVEVSPFAEQTAKMGISVTLTEKTLRDLQRLATIAQLQGRTISDLLGPEMLNFYEKVIVQALLDTAEWLRGQALGTGAISWTFNGKTLNVDYGIPAAHKLTARTTSGGTAYGAGQSKFWDDWREAQRLLRYSVRAVIMRSRMLDEIINNAANSIEVIGQDGTVFTLRRYKTVGGNTVPSSDRRDTIQIIVYDAEGEMLNPANPDEPLRLPFMPANKVIFVGQPMAGGYRVGQGSTDDPQNDMAIGYTHVAPTVEGNGLPGRWGRLFVPQDRPMWLTGEGAANLLPVIENEKALVIATSELAV